MSGEQRREVRYERKFLAEGLDAGQVRMLVKRHPALFYERYPPRMVNNLYLDTEDLQHYQANAAGYAERHKVRIRWYGEMLGAIAAPKLEIKVRHGTVGEKLSYDFPAFVLGVGFSRTAFREFMRGSNLPEVVRHRLRFLDVVLANRYHRRYFASRDGHWRITIDTDMAYYPAKMAGSAFAVKLVDRAHVVLELKYPVELDAQAGRIASFFPFGLARSSKYVTGIERACL